VVIANFKAFFPLVAAACCAMGAHHNTGSGPFALLSAGVGAVVFDLVVLRFSADKQDCSPIWIHPQAGGHIYFIPIWILGAIAIVVGAGTWLFGG
jgi:hypothetical protein